ncbi:TetR family transcriptional regulator [Amycolatopsis sp. WAC 01375]|uniref:TetR/AcrR family transcriptional regulator n=1 Tax=Amycolatopsis sp. WAC 01375 TaxID=2203194 RepID=UPI000F77220C|nr:TetR/AcrR family transcriptional regulator [Amycolatopsis sp. WAC 01375]RSM76624.1 TetR family transcriptional regulator [Amycolatopsis sp. WAC 01375]
MDSSAEERQVQRDQEIARTRILDTAARLIGEAGFARLKIGMICARTGYPSGVVYQLFGSKETLVQRLVEFAAEKFADVFSAAVATRTGGLTPSPMDMLRALLDIFFELLTDMPPLNRAFVVLWTDATVGDPAVRSAMTEADRRYRFAIAQTVAAGIADGSIGGVRDPDAYAAALVGQLRGIAVAAIIDPGGIDLRAVRAEMEYAVDRLA